MSNQFFPDYVRSALFVDFDNIYITLSEEDEDIAKEFATKPSKWITWLEKNLPIPYQNQQITSRRILVRKCYLNPQAFSSFRPYFITSAFEVVDCPPLTSRGKTSTDIHMVLDILDAMEYRMHIDEFIILSGDADFTPLVIKLRRNDRRSVMFAAGFVSPAYEAACDYIIPRDTFLKYAIGITDEEEIPEEPIIQEINGISDDLLNSIANSLFDVANVPYGVQSNELPKVYMEFEEFRKGEHWLGFYSLRKLTERLVSQREDLIIIEEDPWRVVTLSDPSFTSSQFGIGEEVLISKKITSKDIKEEMANLIIQIVKEAKTKVPMSSLAFAVKRNFNDYLDNNGWLGSGSFKELLISLNLGDLEILDEVPGYVIDPHLQEQLSTEPDKEIQPPQPFKKKREAEFKEKYPNIAPLANRVCQLTVTPYLLPEDYGLLLKEIAREINERGYHITRTSKTVRDRCVEKGAPIARSDVNFALRGISYTGYRFGEKEQEKPEELGEALFNNILNLCATAQMNLNDTELSLIREWILSKL
jgi:uncharacterized LabA/DUF88 family protein